MFTRIAVLLFALLSSHLLSPELEAAPPVLETAPPVTAIAFTPDGNHIARGSQRGVRIFGWPQLRFTKQAPVKMLTVTSLRFSADGSRLAIAGGNPGEVGIVEIYSWPELKQIARTTVHDDVVQCVAWQPGGKGAFASASFDGRVLLHRPDASVRLELDGSSQQVKEKSGVQPAHSRSALAVEFISSDIIASAGVDRSVRTWNTINGQQQRNFENHTGEVRSLALRPAKDGLPMLASAGADKTVRIWQPTIGRMVRFARLPSAPVAINWTSDGKQLLAICEDGRLRVLDPDTVKIVQTSPELEGWPYSLTSHRKTIAWGGTSGVTSMELP